MKLLVGVMGFSILVCALLTLDEPVERCGRAWSSRRFRSGSGTYVLSLIGGIGGSITMLSYNYWMREEKISGAGICGTCAATWRSRICSPRSSACPSC